MNRWAMVAGMLVVSSVASGASRTRGSRSGGEPRYDPSLDFSRQFDEEVKWDREHPRHADDDDATEAAVEPRVRHRRRRSHRAR